MQSIRLVAAASIFTCSAAAASQTVIIDPSGAGDYTTIQEAMDAGLTDPVLLMVNSPHFGGAAITSGNCTIRPADENANVILIPDGSTDLSP